MNALVDGRFERFSLVLMTNHACNLRCTYCYTGDKSPRHLPPDFGLRAIDRAVQSLRSGGRLELSFFGGEPLLESDLILACVEHARRATAEAGVSLHLGLTTNGTIDHDRAADVLAIDDLDLSISFDGTPEVHDRHRVFPDGRGSAPLALRTIDARVAAGLRFRVLMVVRPDTVEHLPEGVAFLRERGVRQIDPSLDLWTTWTADDGARLEAAVQSLAGLWRSGLPEHGLGWFDETLLRLTNPPFDPSARCGFGKGEVAVAPSGRLYPCERVIGEDRAPHALALPGHVLEGDDFLFKRGRTGAGADLCRSCAIQPFCGTTCPCSNYIRTGNPSRPDGLLCLLERSLTAAVGRTIREMSEEAGDAR